MTSRQKRDKVPQQVVNAEDKKQRTISIFKDASAKDEKIDQLLKLRDCTQMARVRKRQ